MSTCRNIKREMFIRFDFYFKKLHVSLFYKYTCFMITKLTLTIDEVIIRSAKVYAQSKGKSLSHLVENYLKSISAGIEKEEAVSPAILQLKGKLKLPQDFDYKKELAKALSKKQAYK